MISAHESPLAAMAFDMSGTKLATASNKVFDILFKQKNILVFIDNRRGYRVPPPNFSGFGTLL
jgi:hypothetical protein